jgi:transcriptional regulator with XRE-family HTH domain
MEKSIYSREYAVVLRLLRDARKEAGLTQTELAEKLKQSQSFVTKVERGDRRLDIIQLRTICQTFGLTLAEFVSRLERALRSPK